MVGFVARPHVPWLIMDWLNIHWPRGYHFLRFGTWNLNSAQHWDSAWTRHGQDGFRASEELSTIRHRIIELVPPKAVVLDAGCGVGELLALLKKEKECRCFGLDISLVAVGKARQDRIPGCVSALPAIPYASKTFDAVVCTETLEHITNTNETVAEIARVVRPGGIVIISVPHGTVDREEVHVHRFTVKRFKKTLLPYFHVDNIDVIVEGTNQTLLARTTRYQ